MSSSGSLGPREAFAFAEGRSFSDIIQTGIGGYLAALFSSAIVGLNAVVDLLLLPFTAGYDIGVTAVQQLILTPLGLTDFGFVATAREILGFGLFGLPFSAIIALGTILIFALFLRWRLTGNVPGSGLFLDNPIANWIFQTPEEEGEGEP